MNWRDRLPWRVATPDSVEAVGDDLELLARQAYLAQELDVEVEMALAIKRIEAQPLGVFVRPLRALPRQVFENLLRAALAAIPEGDASALCGAVQPLLSLHQSDYTTDLRFGQWLALAADGSVEFGLHADIEGRPDLVLRWEDSQWQSFWRKDDAWEREEPQDGDLASLLTESLDWSAFNAYFFDARGMRKSFT
jgi:hypothetical protein